MQVGTGASTAGKQAVHERICLCHYCASGAEYVGGFCNRPPDTGLDVKAGAPRMLASTGVPWKGSAGEPGKADRCSDEKDSSHRQRFLTCSLPHSKFYTVMNIDTHKHALI